MTNLLPATHSRRTVESVTSPRLGYMPALDGLRAVAILLVVVSHAIPAIEFGRTGVDVFFVLSGFLITALIASEIQAGTFSRGQFYARRAIRLVPALLVMVIVFTPIGMAVRPGEVTIMSAVAALLYLTPFVLSVIFYHTWTLAIEEWFYLAWPLVLGKMFRDRLTLRQVAALVGSMAVLMQAAMILHPGSLAARPSGLLAGAALALWWLDGGSLGKVRASASAGLGVALLIVGALAGPELFGPLPYWLVVGGSVLIIGGLVSGRGVVARALEVRALVSVGVVSYEWYLLHVPSLELAKTLWGTSSYWVMVPLTLVAAFALHYALVPLQARLRGRLDQRVGVTA